MTALAISELTVENELKPLLQKPFDLSSLGKKIHTMLDDFRGYCKEVAGLISARS